MKALPHVAGASMAFVVLRQGFALLGWISWQVSALFGISGGMHFYSMDVSADSRMAAVFSLAMLVGVPLLLLGFVVLVTERLRQKWGYMAVSVPLLFAALTGLAARLVTAGEDVPHPGDVVFAMSVAVLAVLLVAVYWIGWIGTRRLVALAVSGRHA
jgi:bacteriorhodopsin